MFEQPSLEDLFSTELDQENMNTELVFGETVDFEALGIDLGMDETVPAEELELLQLESNFQRVASATEEHERLAATLQAARENGGARGDTVTTLASWYEGASAILGAHAADGFDAEAFTEAGGAMSATEDAEMKVKANLSKLKEGAKNIVKNIVAALKKLFVRYLTKAGRVEAKVKQVFGVAATVKGQAKDKAVSFKGIGYASNADDSKEAAAYAMAFAKAGMGQTAAGIKDFISAVSGEKVDMAARNTAFGRIREGIEKDLGKIQKVDAGHELVKKAKLKGEGNFYVTGQNIGGKILVVHVPTANDSKAAPTVRAVQTASKNPSEMPHVEPATLGPGAKELVANSKLVGEKLSSVLSGLEGAGNVNGEHAKQVKGMISFLGEVGKQVHVQTILQAEAQANYAAACIKNMVEKAPAKKDDNKDNKDDKKGEGEE
ncbi:hypothetical protein [Vibrio phage vB_pir03]|nr:hypothetical protein [Vibrio phage vB_pir03]